MKVRAFPRSRNHERGISMLETMIAAAVMLVGIGGMMSLFMVATVKNQSQGSQATRCTEYAQDKMEQLMALSWGDTCSDTTSVPTKSPIPPQSCPTFCTTATCTGLTANGGGTPPLLPSNPVAGYVDYVTEGSGVGTEIYPTQQSSSVYIRQWSIVPVATSTYVKTITVTVTALGRVDMGVAPSTTLVSQKTNF